MATKEEILERIATIDKAIDTIAISGQSYKIGSRQLTRANLSELQELKEKLQAQMDADSMDSHLIRGTSVAFFEGR